MTGLVNLVSVSGGKDSTATLLWALDRRDRDTVQAVFADTGNEHPSTYEYIDYLRRRPNTGIEVLKADFSTGLARKRKRVAEEWPQEGIAAERVARALELLQPTGIPYLDLCLMKGRFPSRRAQFCTEELKTIPLTSHALRLVDAGNTVVSWQGIRRDESAARAKRPMFERDPLVPKIFIYRPLVRMTADQVFAIHRRFDVDPNPLYRQGMSRVGCMPCINVSKGQLAEIARRFPEHIARIAEWERLVGDASKRGESSFFAAPEDGRAELRGRNIREYVQWAKTSYGGRQYSLEAAAEPETCASVYGLCE